MKILQRNQKQGLVKLRVDTPDDLWYLKTVIDPGDEVTGDSEYKEKRGGAGDRSSVVRRKVWVRLRVEKAELEGDGVRVSGSVVDGSEEVPRGSHHAIDAVPGSTIEIAKDRWLDYHEEKLDEATKSGSRTLLVLFDREQAVFALLRPSGHEVLLSLKGDVPKKGMDEGKTKSFYTEIVVHLVDYVQRLKAERVVAASPSFWKEYLRKELPQELQKMVVFAAVSDADERAIPELLRRPELQQALEGERAAKELAVMETITHALAKDRLAYGIADAEAAIAEGNVKEIAVTEREIMAARAEERYARLDVALKGASALGARVHLISTQECARTLDGLGGIAAVKRW